MKNKLHFYFVAHVLATMAVIFCACEKDQPDDCTIEQSNKENTEDLVFDMDISGRWGRSNGSEIVSFTNKGTYHVDVDGLSYDTYNATPHLLFVDGFDGNYAVLDGKIYIWGATNDFDFTPTPMPEGLDYAGYVVLSGDSLKLTICGGAAPEFTYTAWYTRIE